MFFDNNLRGVNFVARKIVVTSGKGGVGKTTLTANLGAALAERNLRVALLDFDMGLNNLDVAVKVDKNVVFDLIDVVEGRCRLRQALIAVPDFPALYVMPSSHDAKRVISIDAVKKLIAKMEDGFDYVLIDCPAGMETGFRRAVGCADEAIVVCTPHVSSIKDAEKVIEYLQSSNLLAVNAVVNRVRGDLIEDGRMPTVFEIFSKLGVDSLGVLPDDDAINCFSTTEKISLPYEILAENLHEGKRVLYDCTKRYKGVFGKLRRIFKRNA